VWPRTTGVRPKSKLPINIQFLVVPTSSCEPRPSATTRTGPVKITLISKITFNEAGKKYYSISERISGDDKCEPPIFIII
jgi:hypothetical protein